MITTLELMLRQKAESEFKFSPNMSSLFQGVMMQQISSDAADVLHENGMNPYSQHLERKENGVRWVINTLTAEAADMIIKPMLNTSFSEFTLEHKDIKFIIENKSTKSILYSDMINDVYFVNQPRIIKIQFFTPAAFKSRSKYIFHPDLHLIFQSLVRKFDSFAKDNEIYTPEIQEQFEQNCEIVRYNLRSVRFSLEGIAIPAFVGNITLRIKGPQPFVNLVHLLLRYGEYSGVGIKTSMGMGSMRIIELSERK